MFVGTVAVEVCVTLRFRLRSKFTIKINDCSILTFVEEKLKAGVLVAFVPLKTFSCLRAGVNGACGAGGATIIKKGLPFGRVSRNSVL